MMRKTRSNIAVLMLLTLTANVMWSCQEVVEQPTLEDAARFLRAFKQSISLNEKLASSKQCCQLTPAPGTTPDTTDTDRDVKEILYSLLVIKSKIEQICRNVEAFTENFFESLNFIVAAFYADKSPVLCSKVELLEAELAVHNENVLRLLDGLRAIIEARIAQRCEYLEKLEHSLLLQNDEIAHLIKSITIGLDKHQKIVNEQLIKMDISLSVALKSKIADIQQLSRERFVQTSAALLGLQSAAKTQLDLLDISVQQLNTTLHDQIDLNINELVATSKIKADELITQLKAIAISLGEQLRTSCACVASSINTYEQQACEAIDKTRELGATYKLAEFDSLRKIQAQGTREHQGIKEQAIAMGVRTVSVLNSSQEAFCVSLEKEAVQIDRALDVFERDMFGLIESEFAKLSEVVDQHTQEGKADLIDFESHLVRSLARDFCGLDEKIAIGLSDICSDIVQWDTQIAAQSGRVNRLLAQIDGNLSGKVCIKMSGIEKDQVFNRNALAGALGDFRTVGASEICAQIASTQAHLDGQASGLEIQASVVQESTQTSIQKQLGATEALLQGYYVALCEKLSSLESGVCATLLEEFSQSNAQLSEKLSALYQRALLLNTAVSSEIANKIGNLTLNASGDEAVICGKIAAFRAQAIDNINKLCEKFSAVKVNTILALSDVEQQILEKLSDLDATIQEMAIRVSVIAGQVRGIQPLLV